jgi:hypothetical protein
MEPHRLKWEPGLDCIGIEEFGEAYFNLSKLMPIQPCGYRELASGFLSKTQKPNINVRFVDPFY